MDAVSGCPVDILIDLSEPAASVIDEDQEDKENTAPFTATVFSDSVEITRRDSITLSQPLDTEDRILQDVTEKSIAAQHTDSDVALIDDEVFDFDLPFSPESEKTDGGKEQAKLVDEEVFFGPVGFTERCIAAGVAEEVIKPLSPLCPDQIAELAKEAYSVAFRIANVKVSEKSPAESSSSGACQKQPASLLTRAEDIHTDQSQGAHQKDESAGDSEDSSARRQKRCSTFTKGTAVDSLLGSPGKERKRQGTFTKEKPVENLVSACTVPPREEEEKTTAKSRTFVKRGSDLASKIRPPTSRLMKYNSQSKLKPSMPETVSTGGIVCDSAAAGQVLAVSRSLQLPRAGGVPGPERQRRGSGDSSASSTDGSVPTGSKLPTAQPSRPGIARAQSMKMKGGVPGTERQRRGTGDSLASSADGSVTTGRKLPTAQPSRPGIARAQSMKSGRPAMYGSNLALPSRKTAIPSGQDTGSKADDSSTVSKRYSGIPKGPMTKLQLMKPGHLQLQRRSFAAGHGGGTASAQSGPVKVTTQLGPKMGDTVERPYNPALAAAAKGNSQCPSTPAGQKRTQPKTLSMSSDGSTPAKSSCSSSSACGSTPGSVSKRLSLLPTPSKRRSIARSMTLPPPSPMSLSSNSNNISKQYLASSSDASACDSPVFSLKLPSKLLRNQHSTGGVKGSCASSDLDVPEASPFAFKPRKPLVQNTPDLPKQTLSRWSPVKKQKPAQLEDQVSMCTKRVMLS